MELFYKNTDRLEDGTMRDNYTTDDPEIVSVSFRYSGTEESLDEFLKTLIMGYARKQKLID